MLSLGFDTGPARQTDQNDRLTLYTVILDVAARSVPRCCLE